MCLLQFKQINTTQIKKIREKILKCSQKTPDVSGVGTTTVLNTKIREVERKIPHTSGLVKKADYNMKITGIEANYLTTLDYYEFTGEILETKIKEKGLVDKSNISNLIKNSDLNTKLLTLAINIEINISKILVIAIIIFQCGNQEDCLMKVLNFLLHLLLRL